MIVKNEARALGRCLDSARDWVGEMVIIDTGSTDETVAIARAHGASVSHFEWCDDFSAARNAALDLATREWVLVLDGDETCRIEDPADLARALQQTQWDGFNLPISSLNDDGTHSQAMVFRLFRRELPRMRYRGEIHEQLEAVAAGEIRTSSLSCVKLSHDGYTKTVFASKDKGNRNIRLSRKVAHSRPNDPFSWFVLAMALTQTDPDGMLGAAKTAFTMLETSPDRGAGEQYVVNLYLAVIGVHLSRGQTDQAVVFANRGLTIFPNSPDLHYLRGSSLMTAGKFANAAEDFAAALTPAASKFMLIVDPAAVSYGSRTGLAQAKRQLGHIDESIALFRKAVAEAPTNFPTAHAELGALLLESGASSLAVPELEEAYRRAPGSGGVAFDLAWCLYKLEDFSRAASVLQTLDQAPKPAHLLARVWLDSGSAVKSLPLLAENPLPEALLTLGWAHFVMGNVELANKAWDAWFEKTPNSDPTRQALTVVRYLLSNRQAATEWQKDQLSETESWLLLLLRYQHTAAVKRIFDRAPTLGIAVWSELRMRWAKALVLGGHTDMGVTLLIEAANDNPDDGAVYYWMGYCAVLRQQHNDARIMFRECLRCDPQHPQASQALALLN